MKNQKAFTLIELVVALTIFSVLGIAVFSTLSMGLSSWRRGESQEKAYQDIRIFFDVLGEEMRNAVDLIDQPFQGEEQKIKFAFIKNVYNPEDASTNKELGIVEYLLKKEKAALTLYRQYWAYPADPKAKNRGGKILSGIKEISLKYWGYESNEDKDQEPPVYTWASSWDSLGELPGGVKIHLAMMAEKDYDPKISIEKKIKVFSGSGKIVRSEEEGI